MQPVYSVHCSGSDVDGIPGHTGVLGTLPLTETSVSANSSGGGQLSGAGTGVHGDGLADDEAILNELADGLAGVGVGDLADFIRVEPDLALSAADNGRREALLRAEVDPKDIERQYVTPDAVAGGMEEVGQRGVIATPEALIQRCKDPGDLSIAGLVPIARQKGIEMRGSYILDAVVCRRRSLELELLRKAISWSGRNQARVCALGALTVWG